VLELRKCVLALYSVKGALQSNEENNITYCRVPIDGSNHVSVKIFPIVMQYFDLNNSALQFKLIDVTNKSDETPETLFLVRKGNA
jgi:hypothetical protein